MECMLKDDSQNILYQDYTAEMLGMLVRAVGSIVGNKLELPSYYELAHPEQKDTRTADQIKQDILAKLLN